MYTNCVCHVYFCCCARIRCGELAIAACLPTAGLFAVGNSRADLMKANSPKIS